MAGNSEKDEFVMVGRDLPVEDANQGIWGAFKKYCTKKKDAAGRVLKNLFTSDETDAPNIAFYSNEIQSYPQGDKIETILETWIGNYTLLEINHFYIQWLFPNRKPGMNRKASVLTDTDVEVFSNSPVLRDRVRRAFQMMLDFYGMSLTQENQFELAENSEERLKELNQWYNHNYLRITRILLALKELGHRDLMLPWMKFLADLIYKEKRLDSAASSFEKFWVDTLDAEDSIELNEYLEELGSIKSPETEEGTIPSTAPSDSAFATSDTTHNTDTAPQQ